MPEKLTLYVCHVDDRLPGGLHACRRAQDALRDAGHDFEKVVYGKGRPFGLFTKDLRPELKAMSGQEKLPVLKLADGSTVNGSSDIAAWATSNAPAPAGG
jgi:glutathione S-transferase